MNWCRNDVVLIRIYKFSSLVALERLPEKPFPHRLVIFVSQALGDNEEFERLKCVFRYASSKNDSQVSTHRLACGQDWILIHLEIIKRKIESGRAHFFDKGSTDLYHGPSALMNVQDCPWTVLGSLSRIMLAPSV